MKTVPEIGARVRFGGNSVIGPCTGTVRAIYPTYRYADDDSDPPRELGAQPCRAWKVAVEVDELPDPWPYLRTRRFAATVDDLDRCS